MVDGARLACGCPDWGADRHDIRTFDRGWRLRSWPVFVFLAVVIVTGVWSLCACAAALVYRDRASSRQTLFLTAIGVITLAMVLVFYRDNLL